MQRSYLAKPRSQLSPQPSQQGLAGRRATLRVGLAGTREDSMRAPGGTSHTAATSPQPPRRRDMADRPDVTQITTKKYPQMATQPEKMGPRRKGSNSFPDI